ncbi:ubiquitin carboxyl-terminal hydrolase 7-like [Scyliorhinus torazame]|uniref:ubiquitin carboxyl-terminal hydrolase 7-like n=1 Tax=Scyliorhinus torazame TaxID=75743 RepID=UPI003B5BFA46
MGKKSRPWCGDSPESFSGLKNQGATCYLNTLLQTLYMTPEVKETISRFVKNPPETFDKKTSICYHLDALFTELAAKRTAQTCGITRNLGMSEKDVFEQKDIEEYFRRILNEVDKESNGSFNILQIYQSNVINSLTCLQCETETPEKCPLLDIPLPIRPFDHSFNFKSVNESLREFLKITTLCGDNLCYCENCDEKTETETRYYFESLPNILALQLKRFEFDYYKMCFTKLHDFVEIPLKLQFQKINNANKTEWRLIPVESKNAAKTHLINPGPQTSKRPRNEESQKLLEDEKQEDYTTFELFSICNHLGGYGSGHYFAYIKSSSSSKWYNFNDTNVEEKTDFISEASCNDVGSPSSMSSIRSNTAYMLMYRKEGVDIDQGESTDEDGAGNHNLEQNNQPPIPINDLPDKNTNPCIERMEDDRTVQEGNDTIGQNKTEVYHKEQKSIVPSNQHAGSQCANMVEEIKHQGPVGMEQNKYPSASEENTDEDGAGNHNLEQSNQPPIPIIKDLPEKNATVTKQIKGTIEKGKCETEVKGIQSEETDVKEDGQVITENSTEIATAAKTQGEQSQIDRKENIMGEDRVGQQKDSERKTIEKVLDMKKENGDEQLNEEFIESNEGEKIRGDRGRQEEEVQPLVKGINKEEGSQDQTSGKCISERQVESELTESANRKPEKRKKRSNFRLFNAFRRNKTGPKKEGLKQSKDWKKKSNQLHCSCLKGQD